MTRPKLRLLRWWFGRLPRRRREGIHTTTTVLCVCVCGCVSRVGFEVLSHQSLASPSPISRRRRLASARPPHFRVHASLSLLLHAVITTPTSQALPYAHPRSTRSLGRHLQMPPKNDGARGRPNSKPCSGWVHTPDDSLRNPAKKTKDATGPSHQFSRHTN